ncbi:MAG: RDD family protein [bacterium]
MQQDDNRGGQPPQWPERDGLDQPEGQAAPPVADDPQPWQPAPPEPPAASQPPQQPAPQSPPPVHGGYPPPGLQPAAPMPSRQPVDAAAEDGSVLIDGVLWKPAGFWWRMGAFLIDFVILSVFSALLLELVGYTGPDEAELATMMNGMLTQIMSMQPPSDHMLDQLMEIQSGIRLVGWLNVFLCMAYYTIFHSVAGATLGKLCLGLQVLSTRGHRLGYGSAFLRYLFRFIFSKFFFGGAFTVWFDPRRRTFYDMLAGTNVFRQQPRSQPVQYD